MRSGQLNFKVLKNSLSIQSHNTSLDKRSFCLSVCFKVDVAEDNRLDFHVVLHFHSFTICLS
uniref:Uncharacterized protein n=1 Tax=Anguilla anguilla TaxID=7936 RepID=A0A0E9XKU5_ANGAN